MTLEIVGGWILKFAWSPFIAWYWYSRKRQDTLMDERNKKIDERLEDTYTKNETKDMIDSKLKYHEDLTQAKFDQLNAQVASIVELLKDGIEKSDARDLKLREDISDIKEKIAIVATKVETLEKGK